MQRRTHATLFLDSTGLLERSTFAILDKIARVANDTWSRLFCKYWLLDSPIAIGHGQSYCNGGHVAILLDCPIEILRVSDYSDTSCAFIFSQHRHSTFTNIMHLSLSISTYPRSGNGWGFVVICQHILSPGLGHLSKNFHCFWNPYTKCRGFAT